MCYGCRKIVCDSRCPDAPEPKTIGKCKECGNGIQLGEEYAEIDGRKYHYDCLDYFSTRQWLELFDIDVETAEEEEEW